MTRLRKMMLEEIQLGATPEPQADQDACGSNDLWRYPMCGGPIVVIERFTPVEVQLRSPPRISSAA